MGVTKRYKSLLFVCLFLVLAAVSAVYAGLSDNYDYSYSDGSLTLGSSDALIDANSDTINDTLQFTLNSTGIDGGAYGNYRIAVILADKTMIVQL